MPNRKQTIRMLSNTLRHCHNLYNKVSDAEQIWLSEINQGAKNAIELLKEQEKQSPTIMGDYTFCPACETQISTFDHEKGLIMGWCPYCGQELKLDEQR